MGRGIQQDALGNSGKANQLSGQYNTAGQTVLGTLSPALNQDITNPQGFGTAGVNAMNTANSQSIGGSTAGAVGEGNLAAARTRNAGGFQSALDEAARSGQRQLSENAVGIQAANEMEKQRQRSAAEQLMNSQYGMDTNAALGALGLSNQALGIAGSQKNPFMQNFLGGLGSGLSGDIFGGLSMIPGVPCYIAAELYGGWNEPRTKLVRYWLTQDFPTTRLRKAILVLYALTGEYVANVLHRFPRLKWPFRKLFDVALRKAEEKYGVR